jgi:hypothetical protein
MPTKVNQLLSGLNCSDAIFKHHYFTSVYTSGVRHLAVTFGCYWLIDAIMSHQLNPKVREQPHQTWALKRVAGYEFLLTCEDGNGNPITEQVIPFSDFTGDEVIIWHINNTLLLPSENKKIKSPNTRCWGL